jgi:hypothetical protein
MSLQPHPFTDGPPETARVARAAFPPGPLSMRLRDELGVIYKDEAFRAVPSPGATGRSAVAISAGDRDAVRRRGTGAASGRRGAQAYRWEVRAELGVNRSRV